MLTIAKILNNNIAIVVDEGGNDCIAMGKGVAFGRKRGDVLDEMDVERLFTQHVPELTRRLNGLVPQIPEEYFEAAQAIIEHARLRLGHDFEDGVYLALADHIHFSIERARRGVFIANRLTLEVKMIYPDEFSCATTALGYLHRVFDVELPEDEAAFIALHLVNASTGAGMEATVEMTDLIQRCLGVVSDELQLELDEGSLPYYRFMVHLKFFAQRVVARDLDAGAAPEDRRLIAMVRREYEASAACADAIVELVHDELDYDVPASEWMYLALHIERVRSGARHDGEEGSTG